MFFFRTRDSRNVRNMLAETASPQNAKRVHLRPRFFRKTPTAESIVDARLKVRLNYEPRRTRGSLFMTRAGAGSETHRGSSRARQGLAALRSSRFRDASRSASLLDNIAGGSCLFFSGLLRRSRHHEGMIDFRLSRYLPRKYSSLTSNRQ